MRRAAIRSSYVKEDGLNRWIVYGLKESGDMYGYYRVSYYKTSNRYSCTCYNTAYGYIRKHRIYTHIEAVMIYRKMRNLLTYYAKKQKEYT